MEQNAANGTLLLVTSQWNRMQPGEHTGGYIRGELASVHPEASPEDCYQKVIIINW